MSGLDIDTRTDIYSLGVLLYELLTGTTPFDGDKLYEAGYSEIQRIIREEEPTKPSTKISTLGEALGIIADHRKTSPDLLRRLIRGDLDWIVMKSLDKDRSRRYETAHALAEDVQRHLNREPVQAGSPGAVYRLKKFVRKHRVPSISATGILVVVVLAIVLARTEIQRRKDKKTMADQQRQSQAESRLSTAERLYAEGQYEQALSEVEGILEDKNVGLRAKLLHAHLLFEVGRFGDTEAELQKLLSESPEIAGTAHYLLARTHAVTDAAQAKKHQKLAEELLPQTAEAYSLRGMTASTPDQAIQWLTRAVEFDPSHYPSRKARALAYYTLKDYSKAAQEVETVIAIRPRDSFGYALRAAIWQETGRFDAAIQDHDRAIRICGVEAELLQLYNQRRETCVRMGNHTAALADARRCVELEPGQFIHRFNAFTALVSLGDYEAARDEYSKIVGAGWQAEFEAWAKKHVFKVLGAGQPFELPADIATDKAFSAMQEAAAYYRRLESRATRLVPRMYGDCSWSPDGKRLAYGRPELYAWQPKVPTAAAPAISSPRGIEILDVQSGATRLLVSFGKDPAWSPNGKYIAFVHDLGGYREELWIIPAAGGEPRWLALGHWPLWADDSRRLFFRSRADNTLYSIRVDDPAAEPTRITSCPDSYPAVSPDEKYVAYAFDREVRIVQLSSGSMVTRWIAPAPTTHAVLRWSPDGKELSIGGHGSSDLGLWIFDVVRQEAWHLFDRPARSAGWSPDGSRISIRIRGPFEEIWSATLDPNTPTHQALGPGQACVDFLRHNQMQYNDLIKADPLNTRSYLKKLVAVGIEQYRIGAYEDALDTWTHIDRLRGSVLDSESRREEVAFRAMAMYQLGRYEEAEMVFARLRSLSRDSRNKKLIFGTPIPVPNVNSSSSDLSPDISANGLSLYFSSNRPYDADLSHIDIWVATRKTIDDDWGMPVKLGPPVTSPACEVDPSLSADGLELYFADAIPLPVPWPSRLTQRPGGHGWSDLWVSRRATINDSWGEPENLGSTVNKRNPDFDPEISPDGLSLFFNSWGRVSGYGDCDLWVTTRASTADPWGGPINLGPVVNSAAFEGDPELSPDGLMLFFSSNRPGGYGAVDLYVTTRVSTSDPWGEPENLGPTVNSSTCEGGPVLSTDGSTLYFGRGELDLRDTWDIWQAQVLTSVDLNRNGKALTDYSYPIAHWKLDEIEGRVAHDSIGGKNGMVNGSTLWQPGGGQVDGALEFDGASAYINTGLILNPAEGAFSVFAWTKGGTPGRAIISQTDGTCWGSTWLATGTSDGGLMTEMTDPQPPLQSEVVIIDGQWHHIGLVWDGSHRHLYVDGIQVTEDADSRTAIPSDGGLYFGAGKTLDPATFWSGLIDDIRIYNCAPSSAEVATIYKETEPNQSSKLDRIIDIGTDEHKPSAPDEVPRASAGASMSTSDIGEVVLVKN